MSWVSHQWTLLLGDGDIPMMLTIPADRAVASSHTQNSYTADTDANANTLAAVNRWETIAETDQGQK